MIRPSMRARLDPQPHLEYRAGRERTWQDEGLCAETGPDDRAWFPSKGQSTEAEARLLCAACPSAQACFDYAMVNHIREGVWGGSSENQRRKMKLGDVAPALISCACGRPLDRPRAGMCRACSKVPKRERDARARAANRAMVEGAA